MSIRTVSIAGEGFVQLFALERTAPFLQIYISVIQPVQTESFNFRVPVPRSFYGYVQTYDEQSVVVTQPVEYRSQLVWKNVDVPQLVFYRICQLGDYIRQINTGLGPGFNASFNSFGISLSPSFPPEFDPYSEFLITSNPTSVAYKLEPGVTGEIAIITQQLPPGDCFTNTAGPEAPSGCGGPGTHPTQVSGNCLPTPPGSGGSGS